MLLKLFYTTLLISYLSCTLWAQLPRDFPLYHEVVEHVVKKGICSIKLDRMTRLNVLKDTQGFWITVGHYQDRNWVYSDNKQLIWSPKEGYVDELVIKGEAMPLKIKREHFQKRPIATKYFHTDEYNINRFFGDNNWPVQTIDYYKKYPLSSPDDYYSLGRAHSFKSAQYILDYGKYHLINQAPEWLDSLIDNGNLAAQCFKKVNELDPDFKTVVGSIYTKYCNEILTLSMRLAFLGFKEKALATVEGKELYTPATIAFSKNSLLSCPPNAILFTYGDNDTYPLLYLQQAKKIREDVLIVNESLLNAHYYGAHLSDQSYYKDKYLNIGLDLEHYQAPKGDYILLEENTEKKAWPVKMLIKLLASKRKGIKTASTRSFVLGHYDPDAPKLICPQTSLVRSEILLLAILASNYKTRPILFAPSYGNQVSGSNFMTNTGASKYIHTYGINQLFEYKERDNKNLSKEQALINYRFFIQEFKWPVFEDIELEDFPTFYSITLSFTQTIKTLIEQNEIKKAKKLQNNWYNYFAKTINVMVAKQVQIIKQFYQTNQKEKGARLLKKYMTYLQESSFGGYEIQFIQKSVLPQITELVDTYQLSELSKQLTQLNEKF
ncbi:MAG: hypothetical protein AB8E82_05860 [Aureispira sp.]